MPSYSVGFFENNIFQYQGNACECVVDTIHTDPSSSPKKIVKIRANTALQCEFAYAAGKGLIKIHRGEGIINDNILGSLLSTRDDDLDSILSFYSTNGFLFPVRTDAYESIDADIVMAITNHIKATVRLMSALSEAKQLDYKAILQLTLYLLLSNPVSCSFSDGRIYKGCTHEIIEIFEKASILPNSLSHYSSSDGYTYNIPDLITPPTYAFDVSDYNEIVSGYNRSIPGANDPLFKNVVRLYCNYHNTDPMTRLTLDFLFHFEREVGIIKSITYENGIEFYSVPEYSSFTQDMKYALINIAKSIIGEEINSHLSGIRPNYNISTMSPSWKIETLIDALYFSIFYMRPELELYRKCENPTCDNYFLVKTTSSKKKYCCESCANAAQQRRYRMRQKMRK